MRVAWQKVRSHRSYTIDDAARELGVCKATVRRWFEAGLPVIRDKKPYLVLGGDLVDFHRSRRKKQKCAVGELYCFKCRAPRKAAGGMADFQPIIAGGGNLTAMCVACGTIMNRRVSLAGLAVFRRVLEVTDRQARRHVSDSDNPSSNVHLNRSS
jgi:hypothetical protein